jgi:hypothetical protein
MILGEAGMKTKLLHVSLSILFLGLFAYSAMAADPSDYSVKVHVASSELKDACATDTKGATCGLNQLLTVTIDGKKYKLESGGFQTELLPPGDYQARIIKDTKGSSGAYHRIYELLFSDGKTARYQVVGEFE